MNALTEDQQGTDEVTRHYAGVFWNFLGWLFCLLILIFLLFALLGTEPFRDPHGRIHP